jgi:aspartyl-tRNA(Asn)/glutamyl-tRNA(Gln) amidotransferase subunit B
MSEYIPIIGLEIHAELTTESKLFCRCPNTSSELQTPPNTAICPVCLGLPGALPVLNIKAVASTVLLGRSFGCSIPKTTKWDRKNYFYPDLPKGYQISQYDEPLCQGGELTWHDSKTGESQSVKLTRIHLEEDTGKLTHPDGADYSLIDYNRSSIPLLELVTEPVISSAQEAKQFAQEYQRKLRELGIAEASMEKGQMRCEANISIVTAEDAQDPSRRLSGTKVEVKNINSFRSLERAIVYEIKRQTKVLDSGASLTQETRGWNETKGETYSMRTKETADDYRYFPEPDLGRLDLGFITEDTLEKQTFSRTNVFELLHAHNLDPSEITITVNDPKRLALWQSLLAEPLKPDLYALTLQWINQEPELLKFTPAEVCAVIEQLYTKQITPAVLKEGIAQASSSELVTSIAAIKESQHVDNLEAAVDTVLAQQSKMVEEYKAGKEQLFGFFVGQVRKALGGKGDAVTIAEVLKNKLK